MNNEFRVCRICLIKEDEAELMPIYQNTDVAKNIFMLSGIKVLEFTAHQAPALICSICTEDLTKAIKLKNKCIESENYFKNFLLNIEPFLWNDELRKISSDTIINIHKYIKVEPTDYNIDFFENITIVEKNCTTDTLEKILSPAKIEKPDVNDNSRTTEKSRRAKRKTKHDVNNDAETAQCNLCEKSFKSMHSMKDHIRAVHQKLKETDMFKCEYCDRLFKMKYYLNRHIRNTHKKEKPETEKKPKPKSKTEQQSEDIFKEKLIGINCPHCNKFLTSKHSLSDHIRVRHQMIDFKDMFLCDICGKDFPIKYYLIRHIRAAHLKTLSYKKKQIESLPCSICGKVLKSKGNLTTHERTHKILTPDEYWYCDLCGNKFKGRGEMSVHIKKRHLYKIKYPCPICPGKSWRTVFQLNRHVKVIHNNIKDFKCEWCGKEFGDKNKLVCHTRIHTGEQPFHCKWPNCDRKFTHQTDLRRHYWGHTGERPYKCEIPNCMKGFMKKSELLAHSNRCHPPNQPQVEQTILPMQYQYELL